MNKIAYTLLWIHLFFQGFEYLVTRNEMYTFIQIGIIAIIAICDALTPKGEQLNKGER